MTQLTTYEKIVNLLRTDLEERSNIIRWIAWRLKIGYEIAEKFWRDDCPTYAASLAYTTLLALAPLAAVSLSIYSSFEFSKQTVLTFVFNKLLPNAELAAVIEENIDKFSANAASVSIFGVIALMLFSIWVMSVIEAAFNMIWKAEKSRPIVNSVVTYWSSVTMSPILIGVSIYTTSQIQTLVTSDGWAEFTYIQVFVIKAIPYILTWIAFFLIYRLVPNTNVYFKPALYGAIIAGTMFEMAKYGFDYYLRYASYTDVYGAMATIPIFLFWLYVTWTIVLLGSVIAYAIQYPKEIHNFKNIGFDRHNYQNYYAIRILLEASRSFEIGLGEVKPEDVQEKLEITGELYTEIVVKLNKLGLIEFVKGNKHAFLFKIPPKDILLGDTILGINGEMVGVAPEPSDEDSVEIERHFDKIRKAIYKSQGGISIASLSSDNRLEADPFHQKPATDEKQKT